MARVWWPYCWRFLDTVRGHLHCRAFIRLGPCCCVPCRKGLLSVEMQPDGAQVAQTLQAMQRAAEMDPTGAAALLRQAQIRAQLATAEHSSMLSQGPKQKPSSGVLRTQ